METAAESPPTANLTLPMTRTLAWLGFLALLVLHLDFWREQRPELWAGWIPEDLLYRLVWMAAATVYLWWFTAKVWEGSEDEEPGR